MRTQYAHVLLFLLMGSLMPLAALLMSRLIQFRSGDPVQKQPYECGYAPVGSAYVPINIRFYLFALLFLLFDVESLYLLPWAMVYRDFGVMGLLDMSVFLAILLIGLFYVWKRGALRWGL